MKLPSSESPSKVQTTCKARLSHFGSVAGSTGGAAGSGPLGREDAAGAASFSGVSISLQHGLSTS